jgi:predicted nucleotidyltransferase
MLPETVAKTLQEFARAAEEAIGPDLQSLVLHGSAAEGRLRATSDVNLLVVLSAWNVEKLDALSEPLRNAHAAIALTASFVLTSELPLAMEAFAVKYGDMLRKRRVLFGPDPFAGLTVSRAEEVARLRQTLLNLLLRLRERYLSTRLREEQTAKVLAHMAGPLRAAAAMLLELSGRPAASPKAALEAFAASLPGEGWKNVVATISRVREGGSLEKGAGPATLRRLVDLATAMHERSLEIA